MIRYRTLLIVLALTVSSVEARAAVTKAAGLDETARGGWFERFQEARQGPEQTDRFNETYKVEGGGAVDVQNLSGDVRVITGRDNEVRVEAIKRVRHRDNEEARRYLAQLRVEVTRVGSRIEVRTVHPRTPYGRNDHGRSVSASVDYTITVPVDGMVAIKSISGDVAVTGVKGEVRCETVSGNVDVNGTPNLISAKTVSGDVRAKDIAATSSLSLGTVSGSVIASALRARTLDAGSVSGSVQLSNLQVERLQAKTVSGDLEYDGVLPRGGRYEFNAHSGNVRLHLANPSGFELEASSFSGSIRSDFPVTLRTSSGNNGARRAGPSTRSVRGTFGDASAILSIRSFSGNVVITKK